MFEYTSIRDTKMLATISVTLSLDFGQRNGTKAYQKQFRCGNMCARNRQRGVLRLENCSLFYTMCGVTKLGSKIKTQHQPPLLLLCSIHPFLSTRNCERDQVWYRISCAKKLHPQYAMLPELMISSSQIPYHFSMSFPPTSFPSPQQFHPPSTLHAFPVTKLLPSPNKYAIKLATSSALPPLPSATLSILSLLFFSSTTPAFC